MELKKDIQIFKVALNEAEVSEIVNMLMEYPAGRTYIILRKLETQTVEQRALPKEEKVFESITVKET